MIVGLFLLSLITVVWCTSSDHVTHSPVNTHLLVKSIPAKLADHIDSLTVRPDSPSTKPVTLTSSTFSDASYANLHSLDLTRCGLTSIADNSFAKLTSLRHLVLANNSLTYHSMTSTTFSGLSAHLSVLELHSTSTASTGYPGAALAPLVNLERLTLTAIPDVAFPSEMSSLKSLVTLKLVGRGCNVGTLTNATFEVFRNCSRLAELTIRACQLKAVEINSLEAFNGRLRSLNFACNPGVQYLAIQGCTINYYIIILLL